MDVTDVYCARSGSSDPYPAGMEEKLGLKKNQLSGFFWFFGI